MLQSGNGYRHQSSNITRSHWHLDSKTMFSYQDLEFEFSLKTITSFENCWIRLELEAVLYLQVLGWKYFLQILINNGTTYYLVHLSFSKLQHIQLKEIVLTILDGNLLSQIHKFIRYVFMLMQVIMLPHFPLLNSSLSFLIHAIKFLHCPSTIPCFFKALLALLIANSLYFRILLQPHSTCKILF